MSWAGTEAGGVAFEQPAHLALVGVEVVGQLPADTDGDPGRHPPGPHLGVHRVDQVAGLDGALVDLPGELAEQRVLEDAPFGVGEQLLLVAALPGDPFGEVRPPG